ncbi:hypothetical protein D3C77_523820 [compost metagenome]
MGLVHRYLVSLRVALQHRQLPGGQLVLILRGVLRSDGKQRLFVCKRVGQKALAVHCAGVGGQPTGPGRDRAIGVPGFFGAQGGQAGAEFLSFLRCDAGHGTAGQQTEQQGTGM